MSFPLPLLRLFLFPLLSLGAFLIEAAAQDPVVVYRLEFDSGKNSINYRPYLDGYYVAPALGGTGSLLLTRAESSTGRIYIALENFGELFVAIDGRKRRMVLSAAAANDVSTTAFLAVGEIDKKIDIEGDNFDLQVEVADRMRGHSLSADSHSDLPFFGTGEDSGVAGTSELDAILDSRATDAANAAEKSVANAFADLVERLETEGFTSAQSAAESGLEETTDSPEIGTIQAEDAPEIDTGEEGSQPGSPATNSNPGLR